MVHEFSCVNCHGCLLCRCDLQKYFVNTQTGKAVGPSEYSISFNLKNSLRCFVRTPKNYLQYLISDWNCSWTSWEVQIGQSDTNIWKGLAWVTIVQFTFYLFSMSCCKKFYSIIFSWFNRLSDYLEKKFLIYNKQHVGSASIIQLTMSIIDNVQKAIEDREFSYGLVFLNFNNC